MARSLLVSIAFAILAQPLRGAPREDSWIEVLSWQPRAFLYHGFMSDEEADHLVGVATPLMSRSSVVNYDGEVNPADEIRTSYGTFLRPHHDEVIAGIEERISLWSKLPVSHAEAIQVLRYEHGQKYAAHWDELDPTDGPHTVGGRSPRVATVIMYLTDVEEGGESAFPHSIWLDEEKQTAGKTFSNCTNGGVAVHPVKGDALLFFGLKVDVAHLDAFSMHAGCPVLKAPFGGGDVGMQLAQQAQRPPGQGPCVDLDAACKKWAGRGECERNAKFMVGEGNFEGRCRKACAVSCPPGDVLCMRAAEGRRRRAAQQRR